MKNPCSHAYPQPARQTTVLAAGLRPPDRAALRRILSRSKWQLQEVGACGEALAFLRNTPVPVIVCERQLPDGDWADIVGGELTRTQRPSVIVASATADESLWAEALNLGAFDVLATPFETRAVFHMLFLGWLQWKRHHPEEQPPAYDHGAPSESRPTP